MKVAGFLAFCGFSLFALGCTKADPTFGVLDQTTAKQILFDNGQTTKTDTVTSSSFTQTVQGTCESQTAAITAMPVGRDGSSFVPLASITTSLPNVTCATNGKFSFTLKSLVDLGFTPVDLSTYDIQFVATSSAGTSAPSTLHLYYSTSGALGPKLMLVTGGSTLSTPHAERLAKSSNFQATVRVGYQVNAYTGTAGNEVMAVKKSANFQMKTGVAAQND